MPAHIISVNKLFVKALKAYLLEYWAELEMPNLFLINAADSLDWTHRYASDNCNIVLLIGIAEEDEVLKNHRFSEMLSLPNVAYLHLRSVKDIPTKYEEIISGQKYFDRTACVIARAEALNRDIESLRKDWLQHGEDPDKLSYFLSRAQELGFSGSAHEMMNRVANWTVEQSWSFSNQYLAGVFVNALDTLLDSEGELNTPVMLSAAHIAKQKGRRIFVIADGDKAWVQRKLENYNINWPVFSKTELQGADLEYVIESLSQTEFWLMYGITVENFFTVGDLTINC